jgi:hypothetical protein
MASMASRRVLPLTTPDLVSLVHPLYHGMLVVSSSMLYYQHTPLVKDNGEKRDETRSGKRSWKKCHTRWREVVGVADSPPDLWVETAAAT